MEINILDSKGRKQGKYITYHDIDRVSSEAWFKDGKRHGETITYYSDGSISNRSNYENGKLHGKFDHYNLNQLLFTSRTYSKGKLKHELVYWDGVLKSETTYLSKNKSRNEVYYIGSDKLHRIFYHNGKGERCGNMTIYNLDGTVTHCKYKDDIAVGTSIVRDASGRIINKLVNYDGCMYNVTHDLKTNLFSIGCKTKTIQEWIEFFNSDEVYNYNRGTEEFNKIHAVFNRFLITKSKTKNKIGYTKNELEELVKRYAKLDNEKYEMALFGITATLIDDEVVFYKHDVLKAITCGLEGRYLNSNEYD